MPSTVMSSESARIIRTGDELVRVSDLAWARPEDFGARKLVILIHGFTAHGKYMRELGDFIQAFDFQAFVFNYNSYRGIAKAATNLRDFLLRYDGEVAGAISRNGVFIIAHSMGGLVARSLAIIDEDQHFVRGMVLLGTPNDGCFSSARFLSYFIDYGEFLSGLMPEARNPACLSAKELIKADATDKPFISVLNERWQKSFHRPPTLSISGGKRYLALSNNPLKNWLANRVIQGEIGQDDNDGLVTEKSVNMHSTMSLAEDKRYRHFNDYPYYPDLNHTNLKENQTLALEIVKWFNELATGG